MTAEQKKNNIGKREIIFRAWSKKNNRMLHNVSTGTIHIFDKKMEELHTDCVFMQSTGLEDRNGNILFEGDIIRRFQRSGKAYKKLTIISGNLVTGLDLKIFPKESEIIGNIFEDHELLD